MLEQSVTVGWTILEWNKKKRASFLSASIGDGKTRTCE